MTLCVCMAITAEEGLDFTATPNESETVKKFEGEKTKMYFDTNVENATTEQTEIIKEIKEGNITPKVTLEVKTDSYNTSYYVFDVTPVYTNNEGREVNTNGITVTFSLNVSQMYKAGTRVYVEHHHGDEIEYSIHDVTSEGLIWVTTSKGFSPFIVGVYEEASVTPTPTPAPTPTTTPVEEKKEETASTTTSTSTVVTCEQAMGSKNWTWSEAKQACVYMVTNTSAE